MAAPRLLDSQHVPGLVSRTVQLLLPMPLLLLLLVVVVVEDAVGQERDIAYRSRHGSLLCPLVEDYYSYKRSATYGPSRWKEISECCSGQRQSPIDLSSYSPSLCGRGQSTSFAYSNQRTLRGNVFNNGHDPTISFHGLDSGYLYNVPYTTGPYVLDNIHFHFCTATKGSEHAIDGQFYQSEIHLVHYKASDGSLARAVLEEDGVVVIGIMLQSTGEYGQNPNQEMTKIIRTMGSLQGIGKEYQLPIQVNVGQIFPQSKSFFTYQGSMTSPPCSEAVRWVIFREPISVASSEMNILRQLPNEDTSYIAQSCNDRPLQTNGYTQVETNFACSGHTNSVGQDK